MQRRQFLQGMTAASMLGRIDPGWSLSRTEAAWAQAFTKARTAKPWLLGWQTATAAKLETANLAVEGTLPAGLRGTFYRNGPAQHEIGGRRYHHMFDGDGMVQAFRFTDQGVSHLGRYVETLKYKQETAAGRALMRTFGTAVPGAPPPTSPAVLNTANINILMHADRLLALWEAGDAYALDAVTLDTLGPYMWSPETVGVPFSAHPKVEPDGRLWNFGAAPWLGALVIYRISPSGKLEDVGHLKIDHLGMVHDFIITARHLVFVLPPLVLDMARMDAGQTYLDSHVWRPDLPTRVLVVDKADLRSVRWAEMPRQWLFHYGNAWEDNGGTLHFDYCRYPDASIMSETLRYIMRGEWHGHRGAATAHVTLAAETGRVQETISPELAEFPQVDPRVVGQRHRQLYTLFALPRSDARHPHFNAVARRDLDNGQLDVYSYAASILAEEHIVVPRPGSSREGDGWVIGTGLDFDRQVTQVAVFDAMHLSDGPLAVARLPYPLPIGFHGSFAPA